MAEFTKIGVDRLKENPDNPRNITDAKFAALVKSVKDFPQMLNLRPIVLKSALDLTVLGGNMRLRACREAGITEVPVLFADELTEDQQREFVIKDNVGFGEWDWDKIITEWPEAPEWGLDVPDWVNKKEAVEDDYEIPDEIETDIVLGDLFEIGQHRLLCGDSTKAGDVEKVLAGKEPYLMVTDPPYGVNYDPEWRKESGLGSEKAQYAIGKVSNDDTISWVDAYSLFTGGVSYVWCASWYLPAVSKDLSDNNFFVRALIIWNKNRLIPSRGHYHWKHEPCWYAVKSGKTAEWIGDRKQGTIWDIDVVKNDTGHSTQKPVECMARPIQNHDGDVYDPFIGSGTTMVAAHQLNRKCYGIEIDPKYCQVIIDRMLKLDPTLLITKNGVALHHASNSELNSAS